MLKFSIITITYNSDKYLEETIKSVISQNYSNLEYIFIDGGSSDNTLSTIKYYCDNDDRIKCISEPDKGIADAMNKGIKLATGDIVAHLHSDDYYTDVSVLSSVSSAFAENDSYWVTGGMYIVDSGGERLTEIAVREYSYKKLIDGNILLHPSTFISRRAFDKIGMFNVSFKHAMDYDLWLRLGVLGAPVTINKPLACFRAHAGSLSTFEAEQASKEEWLIRKKFLGQHYLKILYHYCRYLRSRKGNAKFFKKLLKNGK